MKKLMSKKKLVDGYTIKVTHVCSAIMDSKVAEKENDPEGFTIPCTIRTHEFAKGLCDLGASINLMSYVIYKKFGLDTSSPTSMQILRADRSIKRPRGSYHSWSPFLATGRAIIDLELGEMKFCVQEIEASFKICKSEKQTVELQKVSMVDVKNEMVKDEGFEDPS
ncbi:uncharacterized protein LOC124899492 [Capsicum annuum]|uniref:uncharacterized protein LOC124899492 n=1 Tax=Capsicum annuum TaxID=4072 RepID=UPI001FB0D45E|nr:uncharacterized protein LOC124899492 [Capsicum annuum]